MKNFYFTKCTTEGMKKEATLWKKIFIIHTSNKGLNPEYTKDSCVLVKKVDNLTKNK